VFGVSALMQVRGTPRDPLRQYTAVSQYGSFSRSSSRTASPRLPHHEMVTSLGPSGTPRGGGSGLGLAPRRGSMMDVELSPLVMRAGDEYPGAAEAEAELELREEEEEDELRLGAAEGTLRSMVKVSLSLLSPAS
jgi:hypothetical protein